MAVTLHFQSTGRMPGSVKPVVMRGGSVTLGRGDDNDVVLPDPDRMVSKHHCVIEEHGGDIVALDLSTNGTFLNYGKIPLGKKQTKLNSGDILSIGPYELLVDVTLVQADPMADLPLAAEERMPTGGVASNADLGSIIDSPGSGQDFLDELIGGSSDIRGPSGVERPELGEDGLLPPLGDEDSAPLDRAPDPLADQGVSQSDHSPSVHDNYNPPPPAAGQIPDDWADDLLAPEPTPQTKAAGDPGPEPIIPEDPLLGGTSLEDVVEPEAGPEHDTGFTTPPVMPAEPADLQPAAIEIGEESAAKAFLSALGGPGLKLPDEELLPTMSRMGHVMRVMIGGLQEILRTRTSIKSEFRISQTTIAPRGNNPLKFSVSPEQAIEAMVKPTTTGYLDAPEAAEQALQDVRAHEIAMMTGMEAALKGLLHRLSPDTLEGTIETSSGFGSVLKGKKARYWEAYEKMYSDISDQAENEFFELFSNEFARAYQEQLERLKKQ
jgi:type VI secretion system FHA domain protein